jgi:excisionase family DNA binding protein
MSGQISQEFLAALSKATPNRVAAALAVLQGRTPEPIPRDEKGPLLLSGAAAAKRLGVCKNTFWRLLHEGRVRRVEISPGCFRVPRAELDRLADVRK